MDYREHKRKKADLVITFMGEHGGGQGTVADLSPAGCGVLTDCQVPVGSFLEVQIQPSGGAGAIKIDVAVVRYCLPNRFGLDFLRMAPGEDQKLKRLVKAL